VLGAGCVALVTGACLAHIGHQVTCINKDDERIAGLTEGRIPRGWCSRRMCSS
jgi:UDPglucose 6-dehydrogenase